MEKVEKGEGFQDTPKNLVKRVPNKAFDDDYLNRYAKGQNSEIMNPTIDGTQFEKIDTLVLFLAINHLGYF